MATGELIKQRFVCNNFRKPKIDDEGVEIIPALDEIVEQGHNVDEEEEIVFLGDESKLKKKCKKRKHDTIQTGCKAKMVVKLLDSHWEVIYFVANHNHALLDKPSLIKYL